MPKTEKKFFLEKSDDLNTVVDRVISSPANLVIVNIPRDSVLAKTIHDFQVLKRECETAGKELRIESVDDHVLELAGIAGIFARNPVFRTRERIISDILPRANFEKKASEIAG